MTLQVIPLQPVPSQTLTTFLSGQPCRINIYQKRTGLYADVLLNDAPIVSGVSCLNNNLIIREAYLGFIGDLYFWDTQGSDDPDSSGLGSRFVLFYTA